MPGRSSRAAVNEFLRPLRRAVSIVTPGVLIADGFDPQGEPHTVTFQDSEPARLVGLDGLRLDFVHRYRITRRVGTRSDFRVSSTEYIYEVRDRYDNRVFGWHWHPRGRSAATWPHLHVLRSYPYGSGRFHPPTGRVSIEAVIRFLIREMGVRPTRDGWELELERSERRFERDRSWATAAPSAADAPH